MVFDLHWPHFYGDIFWGWFRVILILALPNNLELVRLTARQNYEELIALIRRFSRGGPDINSQLTILDHLNIFSVPLEWLIKAQMIGLPSISKKRDELLRKCFNEVDDLRYPEHILCHLLDNCSPNLLTYELLRLTHVISQCDGRVYPFHKVLMAFLLVINRSTLEIETRFSKNKNTLQNVFQQCWTMNIKHSNEANYFNFLR